MFGFFLAMGMWRWPLVILAAVILFLTIKKSIDLFVRKELVKADLEKGLNAIPFWGVICAVLGLLGQITGIYKALQAIIRATEISPNVIARGLAESFTTTIAGLVILVASAIIWFVLHSRYRSIVTGTG